MARIWAALVAAAVTVGSVTALADDQPWVITSAVTITTPMDLGDVIVADGGRLTIAGVPDPGVRFTGNLWVIGTGRAELRDSVIQFMSTYHGQYALAATDQGSVIVSGCDYRVPNGVQHALFSAGSATLSVQDTDFGSVQLMAVGQSHFSASRLDGHFEVILQDAAEMSLEDIPRDPGQGALWVWPEFPDGSRAVYTPPATGFVTSWDFPPPGASGIPDVCHIRRCQVLLWPLLARAGCDLTLRDIPAANWIVVGLHLPHSVTIDGLRNGETVANETLPLDDRTIRLENASIDTWNLYPEEGAEVVVTDSVIGEMIAFGGAGAVLEDTTVDGSGGYFGASDTARAVARRCTFTCDIQASGEATIELHGCLAHPYPDDPDGSFTRFGAFDKARILADQTDVTTTPALGGTGLIGVTWIENPPAEPPRPGTGVVLYGGAALFSLPGGPAPGTWRTVVAGDGDAGTVIGSGATGDGRMQLGVWAGADPAASYQVRVVLTDAWQRTLTGTLDVPAVRQPRPVPVPRHPRRVARTPRSR